MYKVVITLKSNGAYEYDFHTQIEAERFKKKAEFGDEVKLIERIKIEETI